MILTIIILFCQCFHPFVSQNCQAAARLLPSCHRQRLAMSPATPGALLPTARPSADDDFGSQPLLVDLAGCAVMQHMQEELWQIGNVDVAGLESLRQGLVSCHPQK